jgi:hypothetical protein
MERKRLVRTTQKCNKLHHMQLHKSVPWKFARHLSSISLILPLLVQTELYTTHFEQLKWKKIYIQFKCVTKMCSGVMWAFAITWRPSIVVRKHFNLLLENHLSKWDKKAQDWECSFAWSNQELLLSLRSVIQHGCQGP